MTRTIVVCAVVALLAFIGAVEAHICLTYPMMRSEPGGLPVLYPGDPRCYNRVPDCGALKKGPSTATFVAGRPSTISFEQNLNHWWQPKPGHFDVAVSYDNEATWTTLNTLSDFPANNMNTQTMFNVDVIFPNGYSGSSTKDAILRTRYISNNQNEVVPDNNTEAIFYSCADITVVTQGAWSSEEKTEKAPVLTKNNAFFGRRNTHSEEVITSATKASLDVRSANNCVAPSKFVATGIEYGNNGAPTLHHTIHYDTASGWIRWNRNNTGLLPVSADSVFDQTDLWNLTMAKGGYTPQYIVGLNGPGTCALYGGDKFSPWAFGSANGMFWDRNETHITHTTMKFTIPDNQFEFEARNPNGSPFCMPQRILHNGNYISLDAVEVQSIDPSVFAIPAICQQHVGAWPNGGCKAHVKHGDHKNHF